MRDQARNPERAVSLHLARSGSQSERAIWFILPAHGASHIITVIKHPSLIGHYTSQCKQFILKSKYVCFVSEETEQN